jgi:hypothetical protein
METFEETSRITNVSTTMFPSLPRALLTIIGYYQWLLQISHMVN